MPDEGARKMDQNDRPSFIMPEPRRTSRMRRRVRRNFSIAASRPAKPSCPLRALQDIMENHSEPSSAVKYSYFHLSHPFAETTDMNLRDNLRSDFHCEKEK
jgi:hypothetical protein